MKARFACSFSFRYPSRLKFRQPKAVSFSRCITSTTCDKQFRSTIGKAWTGSFLADAVQTQSLRGLSEQFRPIPLTVCLVRRIFAEGRTQSRQKTRPAQAKCNGGRPPTKPNAFGTTPMSFDEAKPYVLQCSVSTIRHSIWFPCSA
jgi:hypothetical protein